MKANFTKLLFCLSIVFSSGLYAQIPLVYNLENTGATCTAPPLPALADLPVIEPLPDPFRMSNGERSTSFSDWECRRNEIRQEIEHYEIGTKPEKPENISASYQNGILTVNVTVNGETLTLTSEIVLPSGTGPFPAVIGMNSGSGSLPSTIFSSRNIARITFSHNQVTTYNNPQLTDPFYRLYPQQNLENSGQYSAWAWGVSRIIDGLELVQADLPIDLSHLSVTGCSYAGKMALFAGAFDERIALTIAQESGGGGAPAWRVSETIGNVEKLGATSDQWFSNEMFQFSGSNVSKLPHDHHELMAMVAPRALLITGNTDYEWLANPSAYVSATATKKVYSTLGIGDRFGYYIDGGHGHCAVPSSQTPTIEAFVDKFLLADNSVNTDAVEVQPYGTSVDYERWTHWWGTEDAVFPPEAPSKKVWLEAECATVGANWDTVDDPASSNGKYVTVKAGLNSTSVAPSDPASILVFPFTIDSAGAYHIRARVNCPTADDDSYYIKIDNGSFVTVNGLSSTGWQWPILASTNFDEGAHTLTIAFREDGANLDKLLITTSATTPSGTGDNATNCGTLPVTLKSYNAIVNPLGETVLKWNSLSEINNKEYKVERTGENGNYTTIAIIAGKGTFNGESTYSYIDKSPLKGKNYYRLVQVDMDGKEKELGIRAVNVDLIKQGIKVYPNPIGSEFNIDLGEPMTGKKKIAIINTAGKLEFKKVVNIEAGRGKVHLDKKLIPGMYVLKIDGADSLKIIID